MKSSSPRYEKRIMLGLLIGIGVMALYLCFASAPAQAFVGGAGFASTVDAATTAAVAGYGAAAATSAADDDD